MTDLIDPAVGSAPGWPLVLYFHHVTDAVDHYTALSPEKFRRGLETVLDIVGPAVDPATVGPGFQPPDGPSVLITFDDGYRDNLETAAPLLAEFDVKMLLFCITGELDAAGRLTNAQRAALPPRQSFLTWPEANDLADTGHVLAPHTVSHAKLTELQSTDAAAEVSGSVSAIQARTGMPARTFAYPYGLIPQQPVVPPDVLAFGSVKSAATPWPANPHRIRRTYLPSDAPDEWGRLAKGWRDQWFESR
jgi:peptidoglycan/xylan/chitin deacetylase (PgdA/CDA1 family)